MPAATVDRWIEQAKYEAALMGSELAGVEHLLLGLMSGEQRASLLLSSVGTKLGQAREFSARGRVIEPKITPDSVLVGGLICDVLVRAEKLAAQSRQEVSDVHILQVLVNADQQCVTMLRELKIDIRKLEERIHMAVQLFPRRGALPDSVERTIDKEAFEADDRAAQDCFAGSAEQGLARWFAPDALQALRIAQRAADLMQTPIKVEDLLVGLQGSGATLAARVMEIVDTSSLKRIAKEIDASEASGELGGDLFSPFALKAIKLAWGETRTAGSSQLSSMHLLLGIEVCVRNRETESQSTRLHSGQSRQQQLLELRSRLLMTAFELEPPESAVEHLHVAIPEKPPSQSTRESHDDKGRSASFAQPQGIGVCLTKSAISVLKKACDVAVSENAPEVNIQHIVAALLYSGVFDEWMDRPLSEERKRLATFVDHRVEFDPQVIANLITINANTKRESQSAVSAEDIALSIFYSGNEELMAFLNAERVDVQSAAFELISRRESAAPVSYVEIDVADFDLAIREARNS